MNFFVFIECFWYRFFPNWLVEHAVSSRRRERETHPHTHTQVLSKLAGGARRLEQKHLQELLRENPRGRGARQ
jgi:hypothetical protein